MTRSHKDNDAGCAAGCPQCPPAVPGDQATDGPLSGRRLAVAAIGVFLAPLVLALVGSMIAGSGHEARIAGAAAGLAVGIAAAICTGKLIGRRGREPS